MRKSSGGRVAATATGDVLHEPLLVQRAGDERGLAHTWSPEQQRERERQETLAQPPQLDVAPSEYRRGIRHAIAQRDPR